MSLPRIAIVGRPNVGKSSLMNMLAKAKVSIVDPTPGVTRDRVTAVIELTGPLKTETPKLVEVIDTGGYGVYTAEGARFDDAGSDLQKLTSHIEHQIGAAVAQADLILFVVDAQAGITALDETIARLLRQRAFGGAGNESMKVIVVANKVDADNWEPYAMEASALGFGEPLVISATVNYRRREFCERLFELLPDDSQTDESEPEMKLALVGRRNAGKSSFVNALAGEERCIVSEIAGTTRDAIDVRFQLDGHSLVAIDTAGVRKRTKLADRVEYWALQRCQMAITRADVVLLLIDATEEISGVDKRLGRQIIDEFKPCVIVVTKWDLAEGRKGRTGKPVTLQDYQAYLEEELTGLSYCPIVFTSAADRRGLREVVDTAFELFRQSRIRVTTGELNRVFKEILSERGPSSRLGTLAKIYFATQVTVQPPTIVCSVNKPDLFRGEYERFLLNRLREQLPFDEVPIRLLMRPRRQDGDSDRKSGGSGARAGKRPSSKSKAMADEHLIEIDDLD